MKKEKCSRCNKEAKYTYTPYTEVLCEDHAEEFAEKHGIGKPVPEGGSIPQILWPLPIHRMNLMTGSTVEKDPGLTKDVLLKLKKRGMHDEEE